MSDRARCLELLPFYVNGTLSANDRAWVQDYLRQNPQLRSQLQFQGEIRSALIESIDNSLQTIPDTIGFAHVTSLIRAEAQTRLTPQRRGQRLLEWLLAARSDAGWRIPPAFAAALLLVGGQGAWLVYKETGNFAEVRSTGRVLADGPLLRVNFKPRARESDIRLLLIEARALIVAGPTRLGDYYLKAPPERLSAVRDRLTRSRLVQRVDEVPGLPEEVLE